jgi:RNA polymerase sigma factor (sigma-70 family)
VRNFRAVPRSLCAGAEPSAARVRTVVNGEYAGTHVTPRRLIEPARLAGAVLRTQSDERLVDLVREGNDRAFEAIVHRYHRPLLRYCGRFLTPPRAEDAVQQAFVNAFSALRSGDAEMNLRPWLYRIAHNSALNVLRQAGADTVPVSEEIDGVETPPQALERGERLRSVVAAVRELPARQRDALVLQALEGRSYDEIAVELGVTDGAVRQLLNRARTTLREGATALTPTALATRFGGALDAPVADRVAQLVAGAGGGAAVAKGVTMLALAGAVVGGAAEGVLPVGGGGGSDRPAAAVAAPPAGELPSALRAAVGSGGGGGAGTALSVADRHGGLGRGGASRGGGRGRGHGGGGAVALDGVEDHGGSGSGGGSGGSGGGSGRGGSGGDGGHDGGHSGPGGGDDFSGGDDHGGGGSSGGGSSGDSFDDHSGPGGGGDSVDDRSGSGGGSFDDDSSSSGPGPGPVVIPGDDSSGSSGSDDGSGSGTSGSGSSHRGSDDDASSGSG